MNTPAHLIIGMTALGRVGQPAVTTAAFIGALLPDLSLYLLASWHLFILSTPPEVVFGELYYSNAWQTLFRIDNSIVLWGIGLGVAFMFRSAVFMALCAGALLHLGLDFPLHHDDGRAHFWPITDWIFVSPVSYWDPRHYGNIVAPIEVAIVIACCVVLWRRHTHRVMRGFVALLGALQAAPVILFGLMF